MKELKYELQNIISGKSGDSTAKSIASITRYLTNCKTSGTTFENGQFSKEQEEEKLIEFIQENNLWYKAQLDENLRIGAGAEQIVYYLDNENIVLKLNDSIFYTFWVDYLNNLLLHNFFFPDTNYHLLGFRKTNEHLFAVVRQVFVEANQPYDFEHIKKFLEFNRFRNNRNFDFINDSLGIILEDLHDENVLFRNDIPYFIDTVFYLKDSFYTSI